jgi:hypothetical protein
MELLILIFPRDDKISYGKEGNEKNWGVEYHESGSRMQLGTYWELIELIEKKEMERFEEAITCKPKKRTTGGLNPVLEHL